MWPNSGFAPNVIAAFLLTHPVWDVTLTNCKNFSNCSNFYSHIPCGMWLASPVVTSTSCRFLLTHPVWDVTLILPILKQNETFLLTHPVWDVTRVYEAYLFFDKFLLTHPVWDVTLFDFLAIQNPFISTHTSRVGCDPNSFVLNFLTCGFLLTHPVWDVTCFLFF